jgi:hypothetical protein
MDQNQVIFTVDSLFEAYKGFERYDEPLMISEDNTQARGGWGNWEQFPPPTIVVNNTWIQDTNYSIDFPSGIVSFNTPIQAGTDLRATYNMRLYNINLISQFIPNAVSCVNIRKPQTNFSLGDMPDNWLKPVVLSVYLDMCRTLILKMQMFKWRRLFSNPESVEVQMRATIEDAKSELEIELATVKRRGMITPQAVASWNIGRAGLYQIDNINFQDLVISR